MEEDCISRKRLRKKVLDRWENEGGKLSDDQTEIIKGSSSDELASKDNVTKTSESLTANASKVET